MLVVVLIVVGLVVLELVVEVEEDVLAVPVEVVDVDVAEEAHEKVVVLKTTGP